VPVDFVIQNAVHMRCIMLSSVPFLSLRCSLTLSHKRRYFPEKVFERKMCLFFSANFV
jgi:hypothetical protein